MSTPKATGTRAGLLRLAMTATAATIVSCGSGPVYGGPPIDAGPPEDASAETAAPGVRDAGRRDAGSSE